MMTKDISFKEFLVIWDLLNETDYQAYPAKIERDHVFLDRKTGKKKPTVSRVSIRKICEKFENLGVLTHRMGPTLRRTERSKYYRANETREAYLALSEFVSTHGGVYGYDLILRSQYAQLLLNRQLVLEILKEKMIFFQIPFNSEYTFQETFTENGEKKLNFRQSEISRINLPVLGTYPKIFEDEESIQKIVPDENSYFQQPPHTFENRIIHQEDISRFYQKIMKKPQKYYQFRIEDPWKYVMISEEDLASIQELNVGKFDVLGNVNWIKDYYKEYQEQHVILPILCLIQISPSALYEFLFSNWEKRNIRTVKSGSPTEPIDSLLFRLLLKAMDDVVQNVHFYDGNLLVQHVYFGETERNGERLSSLLTLGLKDGRSVVYEGGFNTDILEIALNDEDVIPISPNNENSNIRTKVIGEQSTQYPWFM